MQPIRSCVPKRVSSLGLEITVRCRLVLMAVLLVLTSCIYTRLLEVKQQLNQFERYFRVEMTDHFILHFRHPVLFSNDLIHLSKLEPSRVTKLPRGTRWYQDFRKLAVAHEAEKSPVTIAFQLTFDEQDRLVSWDFPPVFLSMVPAEFLELSLRSLGSADIDEMRGQVRAKLDTLPKLQIKPPTRESVVNSLGRPAEISERKGQRLYVYRFKSDTPPIEKKYEDRRVAVAKLFFDSGTDELLKFSGRFAGLKFAIDFRRLAGVERPISDDRNSRR
jgi:hypothetical protein